MKKETSLLTILVMLSVSIMLPANSERSVMAGEKNQPTIEKQEKKQTQERAHPKFSWGNPGPSSPILHPGSIKGAGMMKTPLREIDSVMTSMIADKVMPGAVTFVARRGHIVQHEAYGSAVMYKDDQGNKVDDPIAMQEDTIFDIASLSKIFTTTVAMKLYEQGLFKLDDPVADYIPEFAQNGKEDVTIKQLMTHTSGFKAWVPLYTIGDSKEERLQYVYQYPLSNPPGTTYTYSDLNMITLASIIERISDQSLDTFVKENLTEPLNMTDTMYNPPEQLKQRIAATEYQPWTGRGLVWGEVHDENAWSLGGVAGHAGVFSTAEDLAKLGHMFLNEGRYGGKQILEPETVELLIKNQIPEFPGNEHGLGWELAQGWYMDALSESSSIGHTGYTGTSIVINPNNETIAILLTNRVHPTRETVSTNPARRQFARKVADAIPVSMPTKDKAWFAGYGHQLNRTLTARVSVNGTATLTFDSWYRIEQGYDFGVIEVSHDGVNWSQVHEPYTGTSVSWLSEKVTIPEGTEYVRFRYETDGSTNGRGWYVTNLKLTSGNNDASLVNITNSQWEKRSY
ncbi:serine hydrolase domain-containing protein [Halobacillus hunanensis]|uniref:serine hydrolase domain-containing protein n=1 Tax=Halobacillus hunanensis TaxID=578214 RepID=UPI0009A7EA74|nr:serine hydrolase domain-containing protein [Halobacillus hunanensis]